jgi:hypothetical protein
MTFRRQRYFGKSFIFWIFIFLWVTTSCTTNSDLDSDPIPPVLPTLTPFQPQLEYSNVISGIPSTPQVELTYTPYPTQQFITGNLPKLSLVDPTIKEDSPDINPLKINNPLTGLPVSDPSLLERRPMVIKIANSPDYIRPQSGLTLADAVFEYYIEWGDTRFIAVMYGNDSPMVGPVRSGRFFDEHIARMYNAFLVFKFADPRELSYLKDSTLGEFLVLPGNSSCPPFVLGPQKRDSYNNFFFNTTKWAACAARKGLDNSKQSLRGGFFSEQVPASENMAKRIFSFYSRYSYNYWDYDAATHKYFRYQEANDIVGKKSEAYSPLFDLQTSLPVTSDNIVVLFVPHIFANQYDAKDEVYHIDLIDSGDAYVFRDGLVIPARWNRTDENQPLLLTTMSGDPIYMRPGRTFYQVMGTSSTFTQDGTDWHFVFQTP